MDIEWTLNSFNAFMVESTNKTVSIIIAFYYIYRSALAEEKRNATRTLQLFPCFCLVFFAPHLAHGTLASIHPENRFTIDPAVH